MKKKENSVTTARWFLINPKAKKHPVQLKLFNELNSKKYRNYIIAAGRRSFKTERFAKRHLVSLVTKEENAGKIYFAGAPTIMQAKSIFWNDLKKLSPRVFVKKIIETEMTIEYNNDCIIRVVGLHEFRRVQGQLLHGIVISEYQDCEPGVYNESIEPMINDTRGWCIKEGRPMGKNHFYDDFLKGKQAAKGWQSYHWTSEDILEPEQIEEAKANLAKSDYEREYKASFETASQRPYYSYTEKNNERISVISGIPFIVACDFNAQEKPMSWVVGQRISKGGSEITYWHKSLSFQFTNTAAMCRILDEDYFGRLSSGYPGNVLFYGDYAGNKYTSNASKSDWDIIKNYFNNRTSCEFRYRPCKSIRDSIAATNGQLCNTKGEIKQFVDPENCKELIKDWEYCSWKDNGRELNERDPLRTHCCRAVDYYNEYEYPIRTKQTVQSFRTI